MERLRDFFVESLHDFFCLRGCMIFLVDRLCDFFVERLHNFVCGKIAWFLCVEKLCDLSHTLTQFA